MSLVQLQRTFKDWVAEGKRLRQEAAAAEADFFLHLMKGEENTDLWRLGGGFSTFAEALAHSELTEAPKYAKFKLACERFGFDAVRKTGVPAIFEVNRIPPGVLSKKYPGLSADQGAAKDIAALRDRSGTSVSPRTAQAIVRDHYLPEKEAPDEVPLSREKELLQEVKELKCQLAAAKREAQMWKRKYEKATGAPSASA